MNFEDAIKAALNEGASFEQIANAFSDSLNSIEASRRKQEEKLKERDQAYSFYWELIEESLAVGRPTLEGAAAMATLYGADLYHWGKEDMNAYYKTTVDVLKDGITTWEKVKDIDSLEDLIGALFPTRAK